MRKVKMTFSNLYSLSEKVGQLSMDLHKCSLELDSILDSIEETHSWVGNDQSSYYQLMKEKYMTALKQVNDTLDDYSTFLEKSSQANDNLENDLASKNIMIY